MNKLFGVDIKASVIVVLEFKTPIPLQHLKLTFFRWRPLLVILSQSNPMIEKSHLPTHKISQLVQNHALFQSIRFTKHN